MRRVVLFKSASDEYRQAFSEHNYQVSFVEPLQFSAVNGAALAARLGPGGARRYAGLAVTSPRAVDALAACWDPAKFALWNTKKVYAVGEATCHKIKLLLGLEALGSTAGNAENLAKIIIEENPESSEFLFPCGNLRSETLPTILQAEGIIVDSLTVYETKENEQLRIQLMQLNESAEDPCCMVFFSPSGCEYTHRQLQTFSNKLYRLPHFAIGNATAHRIETLGIEIAGVAARPRPDAAARAVTGYFTATTTTTTTTHQHTHTQQERECTS